MAYNRRPLPASHRFVVLRRDGYACQICGTKAADGATLHVDHKRARRWGGSNRMENLWTLCQMCNLGKGVRSLEAQPASGRRPRKRRTRRRSGRRWRRIGRTVSFVLIYGGTTWLLYSQWLEMKGLSLSVGLVVSLVLVLGVVMMTRSRRR